MMNARRRLVVVRSLRALLSSSKKIEKALRVREMKERDRKIIGKAKKLACMVKRGDRDYEDVIRVLDVMLVEAHFVKELKHLHFNWDKHPHAKHVGLG